VKFIDQLTNWYVRLNRQRLKGMGGEKDCNIALCTLFEVLFTITKAMAPFTPFLTEYFYQNLRKVLPEKEREDSVHYLMFPTPLESAMNTKIEEAVSAMQAVVQLGRAARDRKTLPLKFPLTRITVIHKNPTFLQDVTKLESYILAELNIKELVTTSDESAVVWKAKPDLVTLGKRLKRDMAVVAKGIKELTHDQLMELQSKGSIHVAGFPISSDEVQITREFSGDTSKFEPAWDENVMTILDLQVDEKMRQEGLAREIINRVQKLRKKAGIHPSDPIEVFYKINGSDVSFLEVIKNYKQLIEQSLGVALVHIKPESSTNIESQEYEISGSKIHITISRLAFSFNDQSLQNKFQDESLISDIKTFVLSREYFGLLKKFQENGKLSFSFEGKKSAFELELGKDLFPSVSERLSSGV